MISTFIRFNSEQFLYSPHDKIVRGLREIKVTQCTDRAKLALVVCRRVDPPIGVCSQLLRVFRCKMLIYKSSLTPVVCIEYWVLRQDCELQSSKAFIL